MNYNAQNETISTHFLTIMYKLDKYEQFRQSRQCYQGEYPTYDASLCKIKFQKEKVEIYNWGVRYLNSKYKMELFLKQIFQKFKL